MLVEHGCVSWLLFFFFKQKTAYELRISDWSSDVCSSDLRDETRKAVVGLLHPLSSGPPPDELLFTFGKRLITVRIPSWLATISSNSEATLLGCYYRSEEHTSELQSLMRISYAVFCLKNKIYGNRNSSTPAPLLVLNHAHTDSPNKQK